MLGTVRPTTRRAFSLPPQPLDSTAAPLHTTPTELLPDPTVRLCSLTTKSPAAWLYRRPPSRTLDTCLPLHSPTLQTDLTARHHSLTSQHDHSRPTPLPAIPAGRPYGPIPQHPDSTARRRSRLTTPLPPPLMQRAHRLQPCVTLQRQLQANVLRRCVQLLWPHATAPSHPSAPLSPWPCSLS